jgi:hypothetical protein
LEDVCKQGTEGTEGMCAEEAEVKRSAEKYTRAALSFRFGKHYLDGQNTDDEMCGTY